MPEEGAFRLGVNYWPASRAMGWLAGYDPGQTRRDFRRIVGAGLRTIRVFVRWEDAQPEPGRIAPGCLAALVDSADGAAENGAQLIVTLFTGHMSGVNWIPRWATVPGDGGGRSDRRFRIVSAGQVAPPDAGMRNWYADAEIVAAQERLAGGVAAALSRHPAVWAWDLGNENSNCTLPPDRAAALDWLERMSGAVRAADPGRLVTTGLHMEDLEEDRLIGPAEAARYCDFISMHGYPIYARWGAGPTDPDLVPFLAEVTRWLAGGKPVLFEEFGLPTIAGAEPSPMAVGEAEAAAYTGAVLDRLRTGGCLGALLWCFTDYRPERFAEPPFDQAVHERSFGLWRADGSPKPAVAVVSRRVGMAVAAAPDPAGPGGWLDVTPEEFSADRLGQLPRLYGRYRAARLA